MSLPSIQATGLSCVRRDRLLFSNVNITLSAGDLIYLSGPNGAGKTSLLRMLVGFVQPSSGVICFNGESTEIDSARRAMNTELVYVGHKSAITPYATALENSRFWCDQQGLDVTQQRIYEVLMTLGLVGLEDIPCAQLSAGQNRRVALARLWFKVKAKFWILDEPFTALDVTGISLIEKKIEMFLQQGGSVLLTSHQPLQYLTKWRDLILEYQI